jgi:hypothetical protein
MSLFWIYRTDLGTVPLGSVCILGTSDFDTQMSGIKIWKGDENLRSVSKKTVFRNTDWLVAYWTF